MSEEKRYQCPECGETDDLVARMTAEVFGVPLDGDRDFDAHHGCLDEASVDSIRCGRCDFEAEARRFEGG